MLHAISVSRSMTWRRFCLCRWSTTTHGSWCSSLPAPRRNRFRTTASLSGSPFGGAYPSFACVPFKAALKSSAVEVGLGGGLRTTWGWPGTGAGGVMSDLGSLGGVV